MLKRALVIGASHFLGAHLAKRLVRLGFRVTALVDTNDTIWRLTEVLDVLELKRANFFSPKELNKVARHYSSGHVFYVSSYGEKEHQSNKDLIYYFNFFLMKELLSDLTETGLESFVYISSSLEHLANSEHNNAPTQNCSHSPLPCHSATLEDYSLAKSMATKHLVQEALASGLPIYSIRPYFAYGPYFSHKTSFGKFILNASLRNRLDLHHDFINKDFIHIRDFVNFAVSITMLKPRNRVVFDCGSGNIFTIEKLLDLMKEFLPTLNTSAVNPSRYICKNDVKIPAADFTVNKEIVPSWEPSISLDFGIKDILGWASRNAILYRDFFQEESDQKNKYYFPWML